MEALPDTGLGGVPTLMEGPTSVVVTPAVVEPGQQAANPKWVWHPIEVLPAPGAGKQLVKTGGLLTIKWQAMGGWFVMGLIEAAKIAEAQGAVEFAVLHEPRLANSSVIVTEITEVLAFRCLCQRYAPQAPPTVQVTVTKVN